MNTETVHTLLSSLRSEEWARAAFGQETLRFGPSWSSFSDALQNRRNLPGCCGNEHHREETDRLAEDAVRDPGVRGHSLPLSGVPFLPNFVKRRQRHDGSARWHHSSVR